MKLSRARPSRAGEGREFVLQSSSWSLVQEAAQCEVAADGGQGQHLVQGDPSIPDGEVQGQAVPGELKSDSLRRGNELASDHDYAILSLFGHSMSLLVVL